MSRRASVPLQSPYPPDAHTSFDSPASPKEPSERLGRPGTGAAGVTWRSPTNNGHDDGRARSAASGRGARLQRLLVTPPAALNGRGDSASRASRASRASVTPSRRRARAETAASTSPSRVRSLQKQVRLLHTEKNRLHLAVKRAREREVEAVHAKDMEIRQLRDEVRALSAQAFRRDRQLLSSAAELNQLRPLKSVAVAALQRASATETERELELHREIDALRRQVQLKDKKIKQLLRDAENKNERWEMTQERLLARVTAAELEVERVQRANQELRSAHRNWAASRITQADAAGSETAGAPTSLREFDDASVVVLHLLSLLDKADSERDLLVRNLKALHVARNLLSQERQHLEAQVRVGKLEAQQLQRQLQELNTQHISQRQELESLRHMYADTLSSGMMSRSHSTASSIQSEIAESSGGARVPDRRQLRSVVRRRSSVSTESIPSIQEQPEVEDNGASLPPSRIGSATSIVSTKSKRSDRRSLKISPAQAQAYLEQFKNQTKE